GGVVEVAGVLEHIRAGVDDDVDPLGIGGLAQTPDVLGVLFGAAHAAAAVDRVLDVHSHGSGLEETGDEVGGGSVVPGFEVRGDWHIHRRGDAGDPFERLFEGHRLPVGVP